MALKPRNQALSIGSVSHDGGVPFGRDALPDIDDAAKALQAAVAESLAAA